MASNVKRTAQSDRASLAVWDVPMPVIIGERISIKVGAKSAHGRSMHGDRIEVCNAAGAAVATGRLGPEPWAETEALFWTALDVPAPSEQGLVEYSVRLVTDYGDIASSRFSVAVVGRPEHKLTVTVSEQATKVLLTDVEIRVGAFRARTGKTGCAILNVCSGDYSLVTWLAGHYSEPKQIAVTADTSIDVTMLHVPEDHPDARWVK